MATERPANWRLSTYPWFLSGFCLFLFTVAAYQSWFGDISLDAKVLGLGIPAFFMSILTRVIVEIDSNKRVVFVMYRNAFRRVNKQIQFDDIRNVALDTGKGFFSNSGVVTIWTESQALNVTAMGIIRSSLPREWEKQIRRKIFQKSHQ